MTSGMTRVPVDLSAEWIPKTVTTDPPRLTPHQEWRLLVRVAAPTPIRVAVLMCLPTEAQWGLRPEAASELIEISLDFFPHDWSTSDRVQINFGWRRITVTDPDLKADPRRFADVVLPDEATTGQMIPVCEISSHAIEVGLVALAQQDTEARRLDRWRLRPQLLDALPPNLAMLADGRQSGVVRRDSRHDKA
jgi:hypothetical protein